MLAARSARARKGLWTPNEPSPWASRASPKVLTLNSAPLAGLMTVVLVNSVGRSRRMMARYPPSVGAASIVLLWLLSSQIWEARNSMSLRAPARRPAATASVAWQPAATQLLKLRVGGL